MIKVTSLDKIYGKGNKIHVINKTTLSIEDKGLVCFLGASGSGKTTLLNVLGGLDKANGKMEFDKVAFDKYKMTQIDKFRNENIGYVFQNYHLLPNYTVYENLEIALQLIGVTDKEEIDKRINYCLACVDMQAYKHRDALNLSGGQQQRISIARALVKDANILVCDEPTGNLDSKNTILVMNILKAISKTKLVLLVTHDTKMASFYADRIVKIADGKIIEDYLNERTSDELEYEDGNIYLKNYNKEVMKADNLDVGVYANKDFNLELDIVFDKNKYFIDLTSLNIDLISSSSEIKVIDDVKPRVNINDTFEFSTKIFDKNKKEKKGIKHIFKVLKNSFISLKRVRRRQKFLYVGFVFLGAILAIAIARYGTFSKYNKQVDKMTNQNEILISNDYIDTVNFNSELSSIGIYDTIMKASVEVNVRDTLIGNYNNSPYSNFLFDGVTINQYNNEKVIAATSNPLDNRGCYISSVLADELIQYYQAYQLRYNDLFGMSLNYSSSSRDFVIVKGAYRPFGGDLFINGIVESSKYQIFIEQQTYNKIYSELMIDEVKDIMNESRYNIALYSTAKSNNFDSFVDMVDGIVFSGYSNYTCLVHEDSGAKIGQYISLYPDGYNLNLMFFNNRQYEIIGIHNNDQYNIIINEFTTTYDAGFYVTKNSKINLVNGSLPQNVNEVLIYKNNLYNLAIGQSIFLEGKKVVGIIDGYATGYNQIVNYLPYDEGEYYFISNPVGNLFYDYFGVGYYAFKVDNASQAIEYIKNKGGNAMLLSSYYKDNFSYENDGKSIIIMSAILLGIFGVYTLFMMRSRMLSRIYSIGVLRALGESKKRMYKGFLVDIIVLTTFTTALGFILLTSICAYIEYQTKGIALMNYIVSVNAFNTSIGIMLIYLTNMILGLLPIAMLLRKTPAEILSKYDI